jgi:uncharacterized protein with PIN domain
MQAMTNEKVIKFLQGHIDLIEEDATIEPLLAISIEADKAAISALREAAEREKGCEYCNGPLAPLYQISTIGHPTYARFDPPICPHCGRRLTKKEEI